MGGMDAIHSASNCGLEKIGERCLSEFLGWLNQLKEEKRIPEKIIFLVHNQSGENAESNVAQLGQESSLENVSLFFWIPEQVRNDKPK